MFSELIRRNSKRNRQENTLYFVTMILTVAAFYIILALDHQDVMIFLKEMERDAVNKLLMLIPILYVVSLCLLYFLVYFTDKYQMERRSHEFGTYLMLGMKKRSLFQMLFLEDLRNIVYALVIGIPGALLISELTSLITAKLAGFGILRHQFTFSGLAALWTVIGICGIKMLARFVLCIKLWKKEVYELLSREQKEKQRAFSPIKTCVKLMMGIILLAVAYGIGCGILSSELGIKRMFRMTAILCFCGVLGTFFFFQGLAYLFDRICRKLPGKKLWTFTCRQLQEAVFLKSSSLAISSLLILFAIICCAYGVGMSGQLGQQDTAGIDFTFDEKKETLEEVLSSQKVDQYFSNLFEVRNGLLWTDLDFTEGMEERKVYAYDCEELYERLKNRLNPYSWEESPFLIAESGYNEILRSKGMEPLNLKEHQMAIYGHPTYLSDETAKSVEKLLKEKVFVQIEETDYEIIPRVCNDNLVADRMLTIMYGFIVPDEVFDVFVADGSYSYWNGILDPVLVKEEGLLKAVMSVNDRLKTTNLHYESYLGTAGRHMFYQVALGYTTIYLAVIFLIIANTLIGVQFLIQQEKTGARYSVLLTLGSNYKELCHCAKVQIWWHYGLVLSVAFFSSVFGVWTLFRLIGQVQEVKVFWQLAGSVFLFLCLIETAYIIGVIKTSNRRILKFIQRKRQE